MVSLLTVLEISKTQKTYNSWYSLVVTHPTTNQPISSLCMAERTGCPVFLSLWSYVKERARIVIYISVSIEKTHSQPLILQFETSGLLGSGGICVEWILLWRPTASTAIELDSL